MTKPKVSDEAVKKATGRDWSEWCAVLDHEGAAKMVHGDIAALADRKFRAGPWWSQMVAVGYEQLRGLRVLHHASRGWMARRELRRRSSTKAIGRR